MLGLAVLLSSGQAATADSLAYTPSGAAGQSYPVAGQAVAQNVQQNVQKQSDTRNWAERMFSDLSHDFGNVARGADVKHTIQIENPYEETVRIVSIDKTCGCTQAEASQSEIDTHEIAKIDVAMDTKKFMNEKRSNVIVTLAFTKDGRTTQETVRVPIRAYIRTDVVVEPGAASFGPVELGRGGEQALAIKYAGRSDWAVTSVESSSPYVTATLGERSEPAPGQVRYTLNVSLDPSAPIGEVKDRLILRTNDGAGQTVPVLVNATVEPDIVVTPLTDGAVQLGRLRPGQTMRKTVVLRGKRPFELGEIVCTHYEDVFKIAAVPGTKPVHVLPLTIVAPSEPGPLRETFEVSVAGRDEPIVFDVEGTVAE